MKKFLLSVALCVAGLVSAKETSLVSHVNGENPRENKKEVKQKQQKNEASPLKCVAVESSCGETGFACDEPNIDGEVAWEVIDDMRQMLEEVFC